MPELPEVETVVRGLSPRLTGRRVAETLVRRPDLRRPFPAGLAQRLTGRLIERVRRRAKYILVDLDGGETLIAHLGMSGRMYIEDRPRTEFGAHDHLVFTLDDGTCITFNDARRFGLVDMGATDALEQHALFKGLGPEPLSNQFNAAVLSAALKGKQTPIKAALLDQRVVAGLGNIYVCEALFRARISPTREAATIPGKRAEALVPEIVAVLGEAIAAGGSSLRDYVQATGELGYFQARFQVYDRENDPCVACERPVQRLVQSGRSTFFCRHCQR